MSNKHALSREWLWVNITFIQLFQCSAINFIHFCAGIHFGCKFIFHSFRMISLGLHVKLLCYLFIFIYIVFQNKNNNSCCYGKFRIIIIIQMCYGKKYCKFICQLCLCKYSWRWWEKFFFPYVIYMYITQFQHIAWEINVTTTVLSINIVKREHYALGISAIYLKGKFLFEQFDTMAEENPCNLMK